METYRSSTRSLSSPLSQTRYSSLPEDRYEREDDLYTKSSDYQHKVDLKPFMKGDNSTIYVTLKKSIQVLFRDSTLSPEEKLEHINQLIPEKTRRQLISMVIEGGFHTWREFFQMNHGPKRIYRLLHEGVSAIEGGGYMGNFTNMITNLANLLELVCDPRDVKTALMKSLLKVMYQKTSNDEEKEMFKVMMDVPYDILRGFVMGNIGPFEVKFKNKAKKSDGLGGFDCGIDDVSLGLGRQWRM